VDAIVQQRREASRIPQLLLQALDLRAERGLRHVKAIRRLGEVQLFTHGDEITELARIDHLICNCE
jgi:hypothetical protein